MKNTISKDIIKLHNSLYEYFYNDTKETLDNIVSIVYKPSVKKLIALGSYYVVSANDTDYFNSLLNEMFVRAYTKNTLKTGAYISNVTKRLSNVKRNEKLSKQEIIGTEFTIAEYKQIKNTILGFFSKNLSYVVQYVKKPMDLTYVDFGTDEEVNSQSEEIKSIDTIKTNFTNYAQNKLIPKLNRVNVDKYLEIRSNVIEWIFENQNAYAKQIADDLKIDRRTATKAIADVESFFTSGEYRK